MTARREDIEVRSPEGAFSAYVSTPERPNGVAVVVLQEIFGVNPYVRGVADGFAEAGYAAVAPDLFWRQAPGLQLGPSSEADRGRAMQLMTGLDRNQAAADSVAALAAVRAHVPGLERSAAVGYCFGGGVAYLLAARGDVDAGVAYYGTGLHTLLSELDGLKGRLLLHIAGEDHLCPPEAQQAIQAAAAAAGERAEVVIHPGAGHAFARPGPAFDKAAADRANALTLGLLQTLQP